MQKQPQSIFELTLPEREFSSSAIEQTDRAADLLFICRKPSYSGRIPEGLTDEKRINRLLRDPVHRYEKRMR